MATKAVLTAREYTEMYTESRILNDKKRMIEEQLGELKEKKLKRFGTRTTLKTKHGTVLTLEKRTVKPTEIPEAYSYFIVKET